MKDTVRSSSLVQLRDAFKRTGQHVRRYLGRKRGRSFTLDHSLVLIYERRCRWIR